MNEKTRNRITNLLAWIALAGGLLGVLMRYVGKDRVAALAVVFYGLPPLVVALLFTVSLALSLRRPRQRWRIGLSGALVLITLGAWIQTDFVWAGSHPRSGDPLRVVLWNLSRPSVTDTSFVPVLHEAEAQIILLIESGASTAARQRFWKSHFPDYHASLLPGEMTLLSPYPIDDARSTLVDGITRIAEYNLALPGGTLSVVAVDVASARCSRRRYSFEQINAIVRSKHGPVLVLGDFNTPHTSIFFDEFRPSFRHAFEESGIGLITTWPSLFPVLALDHIWLSRDLQAERTVLRRTWYSDHAMVIADIVSEETDEPQGPDNSI